MATNYTEHYQLNQWEPTDKVLRTDFNADNLKIDTALKALAQTVAETAAGAGNCEMELFTYTGTGDYGTANPTQILFPNIPDVYLIVGDLSMVLGYGTETAPFLIAKDVNYTGCVISTITAAWSGKTLKLNSGYPRYQMNASGARYWVLTLRVKN